MRSGKPIQISIPNPCTQHWDAMTATEQGRFCDHCQHTVIDFTEWSDAALYNFFAKNETEVCGRFLASQVEHTINIPYQPHSRLYRITVALGLTLMVAQAPRVFAQNHSQVVAQTDSARRNKQGANNPVSLNGRVIDEHNKPVDHASVRVYRDGELKGSCFTDGQGDYSISLAEAGKYAVVVISAGDWVLREKSISIYGDRSTIRNFQFGSRNAEELPYKQRPLMGKPSIRPHPPFNY